MTTIVAFVREYPFATLVTSGSQGLLAAHIPVVVRQDAAGDIPTLFGHLARANPQWQEFDGATEALVIFQGAHGYVSPSLYEVHPSVPTWNYQVVHAYGVPRLIDDVSETRDHVLELVRQNEAQSSEPWQPDLPEEVLEGLLRQIVAFRIELVRVEAKFKLGQNRSRTDRENVAGALEDSGDSLLRALGRATRTSLDQGQ